MLTDVEAGNFDQQQDRRGATKAARADGANGHVPLVNGVPIAGAPPKLPGGAFGVHDEEGREHAGLQQYDGRRTYDDARYGHDHRPRHSYEDIRRTYDDAWRTDDDMVDLRRQHDDKRQTFDDKRQTHDDKRQTFDDKRQTQEEKRPVYDDKRQTYDVSSMRSYEDSSRAFDDTRRTYDMDSMRSSFNDVDTFNVRHVNVYMACTQSVLENACVHDACNQR